MCGGVGGGWVRGCARGGGIEVCPAFFQSQKQRPFVLVRLARLRCSRWRAIVQADQSGEFPLQEGVLAGVKKRLDLPFHGGGVDGSGRQLGFLSCASTENTLRYIGVGVDVGASRVLSVFCCTYTCGCAGAIP